MYATDTIHIGTLKCTSPSHCFLLFLASSIRDIFSSADTTIAELLKVVTDSKLFRETILWTRYGTAMKYIIIMHLSVCLSVCPPELREEDSSDKADEYIEKYLGKIYFWRVFQSECQYNKILMLIDISQVLLLMCLQSQSNGVLKPKLMDRYWQEIIQVCGCGQ